MSKNFDLDPVLLNINSINSSIPENLRFFKSCESQDSAIEDDFNDSLSVIDVIPQLDNYRRSLANTSKQRPTIELLHQSSYEDYLSVNFYLFFIVNFFFFCLNSNLISFQTPNLHLTRTDSRNRDNENPRENKSKTDNKHKFGLVSGVYVSLM
jgi:hypothetical protein